MLNELLLGTPRFRLPEREKRIQHPRPIHPGRLNSTQYPAGFAIFIEVSALHIRCGKRVWVVVAARKCALLTHAFPTR